MWNLQFKYQKQNNIKAAAEHLRENGRYFPDISVEENLDKGLKYLNKFYENVTAKNDNYKRFNYILEQIVKHKCDIISDPIIKTFIKAVSSKRKFAYNADRLWWACLKSSGQFISN